MSKNNEMIIVGADCVGCKYYKDKDNHKITCKARNKDYYYGQCIPCEDKEEGEE